MPRKTAGREKRDPERGGGDHWNWQDHKGRAVEALGSHSTLSCSLQAEHRATWLHACSGEFWACFCFFSISSPLWNENIYSMPVELGITYVGFNLIFTEYQR